MGTLADKLQYLKGTKDAIMNAIIEKGVEIASSDTFRSYADKIKNMATGGDGIICNINYGGYTTVVNNVKNNISANVATVDNLTPNIVGSPLNNSGILSNFTDNDYVKVDSYNNILPLGQYVYIKFKHNVGSWYNSVETIVGYEYVYTLEASSNNTLTTYNWRTNTTYTILDNLEQDKWYYAVIKVGNEGDTTTYNVEYYLSTISYEDALSNGHVQTIDHNVEVSSRYTNPLHIGRHGTISGRYAKDMSIDFNETYIKNSDGSYYLQFRQTEKLM